MSKTCLMPVTGLPEVAAGDDLAALVADRADLVDGDIVVVAQKVVSKAEGAFAVTMPGEERHAARRRLAREQAVRVVAEAPWALVVETTHGLICANAGIDASNVPDGKLALLPDDPDASARRLRTRLRTLTGADVAVVISDTFGRPWRLGHTDVAIGVAGLPPIRDERGGTDRHGQVLEVTQTAVADELAAAADLVRTKADGVPVVVVRGLPHDVDENATARDLVRPAELDLFPRGRGGLTAALGSPVAPGRRQAVADDDLHLVMAAVRRIAGEPPTCAFEHDERGSALVVTAGAGGTPLDAGLSAATAVASLTDLGYDAWIDARDGESVTVRAGRATPTAEP